MTSASRLAACALVALTALPAAAQEATTDLTRTLRPGDTVDAVTDDGRRVSGRFTGISADGVDIYGLSALRVPAGSVTRVTRTRPDSIANGAAIGAAAGLGGGLAMWAMAGGCDCYTAGAWFKVLGPGVIIGTAVGATLDLAIAERFTVYRSQTSTAKAILAPSFSNGGGGLRVSVKF